MIFRGEKLIAETNRIAVVDDVLSTTSENPVQNKVLTEALADKVNISQLNALSDEVEEAKKSCSDGKALVADTITELGIETATDATFATIAENIVMLGKIHGATITGSVLNGLGATLTLSLGDSILETVTITESGSYSFVVQIDGTYNITITLGEDVKTAELVITSDNIVHRDMITVDTIDVTEVIEEVMVYGICRDITSSSPVWERTDSSANFKAIASVGNSVGSSDFDNVMPWSGIKRETLSTGDVMVKIPKFYFKRYREGNMEYIKIADKEKKDFTLHPLFNHGGVESECAYVGAYKTSSDNKSVTGASPTVKQTRATMRTNAKNKGTGWGIIDVATISAIQMLALVEFATNNSRSAIGSGYSDTNSSFINNGSCDSVPNLTGRPSGTDGRTGVIYRGIENFWGNLWEWTDGVNFKSGTYYVCNDTSKYADDTSTGYDQLSFTGATNWNASYITEVGLDSGNNSHVMLPSVARNGSAVTYYCDTCWTIDSGWEVFRHGGHWDLSGCCGLFTVALHDASSAPQPSVGSRLLYIPT